MKNKFTLLIAIAFMAASIIPGIAQTSSPGQLLNRGCGAGILPQQFETWLQSVTPTHTRLSTGQVQSVFNIPVIVHVIHNNEALNSVSATSGGNLNAAQIISQINILNKDFNGLNSDTTLIPSVFKSVHGKFQINFCLAVVNPTGGVLAEPGIDRIDRVSKGWTAPPFSQTYIDATIKPASIWDPTRYMNMWVCNLGGSLLGYATFPNPGTSGLSGLTGPYGTTTTDGLVMLNTAFGNTGTVPTTGSYNKGRTATHEIGHWLGLRHIWGDNGQCGATDYCNDTPPQMGGTNTPAGCNYGCPTFPLNANTCTLSGQSNPNGDMFMNFMDYTNDACMYMFTKDQKVRAQLILTNSPMRASLLTSTVCNLPTVTNEIGILYVSNPTYSQAINCTNTLTPSLVLYNFGSNTISSATFSYNVGASGTQTLGWTGNLAPNASVTVTMPTVTLTTGSYAYNIGVYSPNGGTDPYMTNNVSNQYFNIVNTPSLSTSASQTICAGSCVTFTAGGANSYTWLPGSMTGSSAVLCPTVSTVYTVSGNNGTCSGTKTVNITVGAGITLGISASQTLICAGASVTLMATGASSYSWSNGATGVSTVVNPTVPTMYSVIGQSGICTATANIPIITNTTPTLLISSNTPGSSCAGSPVTLTVTGANSYSWNTGSTSSVLVVNPSVTTVYSVTGSNTGCSSNATFTVPVTSAPTLTVNFPSGSTICTGGTVACILSGACSYTWSNGATTASVVLSPTTSTTYTVLGGCGGCVTSTVVTITVVGSPTLTVTTSTPLICTGSSATLTASGASSYTWNTGANGSSITVSPSASSVYTVTGSNGGGCTSTSTILVTVSGTTSAISLNAIPGSLCFGNSTTLTASGASSYTWNTGSISSSIVVTPTATSVYSVTGLSGSCAGSAQITVTVAPLPNLIASNQTICAGSNATLTASGATSYTWNNSVPFSSIIVSPTVTTVYTVTGISTSSNITCPNSKTVSVVVGGSLGIIISATYSTLCLGGTSTLTPTGATSYTWSNGSTAYPIYVTPSVTTTYSVTGSNGSCTGTAAITILVGAPPQLTVASSSGANSICPGGSATLTAAGATTYSWSSGTTGSQVIVTPTSSTVYTVTASSGGCTSTKSIVVTVGNGPLNLVTSANPPSICSGGSATLSVSGASSYSWSNGASASVIVVSPGSTTAYSVVGNSGSCSGNSVINVSVGVAPPLAISISPSATLCTGKTATLSASGSYANFNWTGVTGNNASIAVSPTATAVYTVSASGGGSGCSTVKTASVFVTNGPVSVLTSSSSGCGSVCAGAVNASSSGGKAPYSYSLSTGACTALPCNNLCPGLYTLYTRDSIGCSTSNLFSITSSLNNIAVAISGTNASCAQCADGVLSATVSGGSAPYTYSWAPAGGGSLTASGLSAACYTLNVRDAKGCQLSSASCVGIMTGLESVDANSQALVYPNPVNETLIIHSGSTAFYALLYNNLGELVLTAKSVTGHSELNLSELAKGIYTLELKTGNTITRKKILKD